MHSSVRPPKPREAPLIPPAHSQGPGLGSTFGKARLLGSLPSIGPKGDPTAQPGEPGTLIPSYLAPS